MTADLTTEGSVSIEDIAAYAVIPLTFEQCGENDFVLANEILKLRDHVKPLECQGCSFSDEPWHDELLRWFVEAPIIAVNMILGDSNGPDELGQAAAFINERNWPQPVEMGQLSYWFSWWADKEVDSSKYREEHRAS